MLDSRDRDRQKFAPMSPAKFQALQRDAPPLNPSSAPSKRTRQQTDEDDQAVAEEGVPRSKTKRYRAEDFQYSSSTRDKIDSWFLQYPVLRKRNFFTIQNHYATSKHFDLRLHIDGGLFSLAIPRGLSLLPANSASAKAQELSRLAVETSIHPLNYALFEGVGRTGITAVWDIGEYRIHPTKKKQRERDQWLNQGLGDEDTTDSETDEVRNGATIDSSGLEEDERQEELLREAIERSSFSSGTIQTKKQRTLDSKRDEGETRGFVLELIGERYRGLRITLARSSAQFETVKRKTTGILYRSPRWYCILHDPSGSTPLARVENPKLSNTKSLLTGRTMEEIGIAGGWEKPRAKAAREAKEKELVETTSEDEEDFGKSERRAKEKEDEDEKETQGLLNVEGDELKWFEAKLRKMLGG
ncbi:hypothetical protein JCM3765_004182 [Sporobolomyces pararoseus]